MQYDACPYCGEPETGVVHVNCWIARAKRAERALELACENEKQVYDAVMGYLLPGAYEPQDYIDKVLADEAEQEV